MKSRQKELLDMFELRQVGFGLVDGPWLGHVMSCEVRSFE